jgi:hypothetical protein
MRHPLFLLLPFVLAATRSLAFAIQSPGKPGVRSTIPVQAEYEVLLIVIFCLSGLLVTLNLIFRFPDLGAIIAEYNQI